MSQNARLPIRTPGQGIGQQDPYEIVARTPDGRYLLDDESGCSEYCCVVSPDDLRAYALRLLAALDDGAHVELRPVAAVHAPTAPLAEPERLTPDGRIVLETDEYTTPLTPAELEQYIARLARAHAIATRRH